MSKRGLPAGVQMRHDPHYVETLAAPVTTIGRNIPIHLIEPNPRQPRSDIGDLSELTASIKEKGVLEPLLVRPIPDSGKWMIVAGERRWRSAGMAGLTEVPCIEMDLDENGVAEIALIENLQRKDLNVWEEADGLASLALRFGYTQEQIAQKISKSRTTVTEFMTIAGLPADIRERCREANINSKSVLLDIARQFDEAGMHQRIDSLVSGKRGVAAGPDKRSQTPRNKVLKAEVDGDHSEKSSFKYDSPDGDFELILNFKNDSEASRSMVLKALKNVFDAVKSGSATAR